MSKSQVLHKISLSGRNGIKRTEIRKEFQHIPVDDEVQSLLKNGEIVMEKRATRSIILSIKANSSSGAFIDISSKKPNSIPAKVVKCTFF